MSHTHISFDELIADIQAVAPTAILTDKAQRALYGVTLLSPHCQPQQVQAFDDHEAVMLAYGRTQPPEHIRVKRLFAGEAPRFYQFNQGRLTAVSLA